MNIIGCPKNLVDCECILTQLRTEGYDVTNTYDDALAANGKILVTGCLGIKKDKIIELHPNVLGVTGLYAYDKY